MATDIPQEDIPDCVENVSQKCFFHEDKARGERDGKGRVIGQMNGRYALLFKVLLAGAPLFAVLLTLFIVPFSTWITREQFKDIANRDSTTEATTSIKDMSAKHDLEIKELRHTIKDLPPDAFEDRVDRIEDTQVKMADKVEKILINQVKIMANMGID